MCIEALRTAAAKQVPKKWCVFLLVRKGPGHLSNCLCMFFKDGHHIDLELGAVYTFIDLHVRNDELNGVWIRSLRLGPCWFYSMLLWMLNKWTSSGHSRCSFCSFLRKQLDRSPNNDTCPGSWISFGRKDRESWSGCHTHVHPCGNK